jgi:hypothetical protein
MPRAPAQAAGNERNHLLTSADRMRARIAPCLLGFACVDLLSDQFEFRTSNDRPLKPAHVAKLVESFRSHGLDSTDPVSNLRLGVRKSQCLARSVLKRQDIGGMAIGNIPVLELTAQAGLITAFGGQHRRAALIQYRNQELALLEKTQKLLSRQKNKEAKVKIEAQIMVAKQNIKSTERWVAEIWDLGKWNLLVLFYLFICNK